jgi:uncharacterized small protein (DUF1192 family)
MAIKDQVLKNAGGLYTTSEEELDKLTQKSGRLQAPINPLETKAIGGNADQAKMAGTPNQKMNALQTAVSQSVNLGDVQRRKTTETSAAQQGQKAAMEAKLAELEGLGDLSNRVRQIALSRFERDYAAPTALALNEFTDSPEWSAVPQEAKDALATGTINDEQLAQIAQGLGITETSQIGQLAEAIKGQLGVEVDSQSGFLAGLAAGQVKLGELTSDSDLTPEQIQAGAKSDLAELGYGSKAELAQALNISEEELNNLSLDQLEDRIDTQQAEMFDKARELRNVLSDPASNFAAREAARAELKQLQAAGIDDVEVQYNNLERQIKEGRTIEFDGKQVPVDELLSSDGLELRIATALSSEEEMARLKKDEPALFGFIQENKAAFDSLVDAVDEDTQRFIELQETNESLAKPSEDLEPLPSTVMETWYDDWGSVRGEAYQPNGVLQLLQSDEVDFKVKKALNDAIQTISTRPNMKDDLKYLGTLDVAGIKKLGLDNPAKLQKYLDYRDNYEQLKDTPDEDFYKTSLKLDASSLQSYVAKAIAMNASGFSKVNNSLLTVLDANKDGKLDSLKDIKKRILGSGETLEQLMAAGKDVSSTKDIMGARGLAESLQTTTADFNNPIFNKVQKYFEDGVASSAEANTMAKTLSRQELEQLYKLNTPGMSVGARGAIERKLKEHAYNRTKEHFKYYIDSDTDPRVQVLKDQGITDMEGLLKVLRESKKLNTVANWGNITPEQSEKWRVAAAAASYLGSKTTGLPDDTSFDTETIKKYAKMIQNP